MFTQLPEVNELYRSKFPVLVKDREVKEPSTLTRMLIETGLLNVSQACLTFPL